MLEVVTSITIVIWAIFEITVKVLGY